LPPVWGREWWNRTPRRPSDPEGDAAAATLFAGEHGSVVGQRAGGDFLLLEGGPEGV
jgi:hypothetical protein